MVNYAPAEKVPIPMILDSTIVSSKNNFINEIAQSYHSC